MAQLVHIVLWNLHPTAEGRSAAQNAQRAKEALESLVGVVPGLLSAEVGFDTLHSDASADLSLYAVLESPETLPLYQDHPAHQALLPMMRAITSARRVIDYTR